MRREEQDITKAMKTLLPSDEQTQQACDRVAQHLQTNEATEKHLGEELFQHTTHFRWRAMIATTVAVAFLLISLKVFRHAPSAVSTAIEYGQVIQSEDASKVVNLPDGSHVEMRSKSKLALENAGDGLRVRLNDGSVIVHAAKQRSGHLYVQTNDVTVSVTGTVFFVSIDEAGSRVAVIEGAVHVWEGTLSTELTVGKQFSTKPTMRVIPIEEEIAWSQNARDYMALLARAAEPVQTIQPPLSTRGQNPSDSYAAFDVASVRLDVSNRGGGRGTGQQSCGGDIQVEPRRFVATAVTLYRLIAIAYGKDCIFLEQNGELLLGGPDWIRSAPLAIQALMPDSAAAYTRPQLDTGNAPQLQAMIRSLLADRFKLALHSEMKEMPVYLLMPAKGGPKVVSWKEGDPSRGFVGIAGQGDQRSFHIIGGKKSMAELAIQLQDATRSTVLDRTRITGEFNYDVQYAPTGTQVGAETEGLSGPALVRALQEQLGLTLEAARAPVQVLVIDRAERPSEN